ncbi:UDP-N-acetylmuramyl pentapeptide phosphotransferase/UDP-N-acetylglucosamine-1-phosphate transferase [Paenibacillus sp. JGP012]|uniref:Undecaprenyl/decaprenyl-phosphate alpha-N-acetylglucosaminyl 1-phosphate transferase n=1 Tax=Paenibacillus silvae TaxID=1325358 RepID=A0A2W6NI07_9BACL|nr:MULTISPECIES: MraY family glycosyltransferase [Paenibacillus]MBB6019795.1 UDP-N-acetylmuramyl pentapeptide phosphotransferase/UDP-N-acetylglucosamine-1-phosphate transferase [Paenibacillus sp. JGP012]MCK6075921.1 undecaprenyl/decaprenyl-phosphate alpha-N-acetylglucosaminyl 1-phosphate transferase [Paenibacillus silvae]MCK6150310.1 undecaprenyl/decaprenyl-phosphate alpha-N-acetylglucosaminyl 1-phosphate transferase [Paenibacillus silvae]MCK6268608.1 undecaprenyl/decaprenyl-phosphate alpha-N-a
MIYILAFILSFAVVVLLIPPLGRLAHRLDFVDKPREDVERKLHRQPIPLTASYAIFTGFFLTYIALTKELTWETAALVAGGMLLLTIGTIDDWYKTKGKDFPALPKMIIQVSAAVLVFASGIAFTGFVNPFNAEYVLLPIWLQFILTILWIFGVTTVINFSDGMDGLAGGLSAISAITLFIVAITKGQTDSALMSITLVGVTLGYLKYNKAPAKVFMGDAGATFLGFILAVIALDGAFKQATMLSIFIPILALGVPIFDNIFVVIKRFLQGKAIYQADASQAHYRLLRAGLNHKQVVAVLYLVSTCLCLSSIILLLVDM